MMRTLFGFGVFGSAGMLAWAAAAVIPLVLHLWNRHRHREAPWAAMEFLLAAVQKRSRRMRLEQLLLLLLRMAIPVVFALALADPVWQSAPLSGSLSTRPRHHHLFVIDTSYSMGYVVGDQSRLDQTRQLIQEIVDQSRQGDGFTLITMGSPAEVLVASPAFSRQDILREVQAIRLRDGSADLAVSLKLCQRTLLTVKEEYPRLELHRIYLFSDMGENTWESVRSEAVRGVVAELDEVADFVTVDVGESSSQNAGISSATQQSHVIFPATPASWLVTVDDFTGNSSGQREVEMYVDGELVGGRRVGMGQGRQSTVSFQHTFDRSGQHRVEFRLQPDALAVDDYFFQAVIVKDAVNVVCVAGKPGAARNVALALAPMERPGGIRVRQIPEYQWDVAALDDVDCLFLCNVGRFTAGRVTRLQRFLRQGKCVVLFMGDQVAVENYNRMLGGEGGVDASGPMAISPVQLLGLSPPGSYLFDPGDYSHPIVEPFRGQERSGLLTTPVWRYVRCALPEGSSANVALRFGNGDPAIVDQSLQRGRVIFVATAASGKSTTRQGDRVTPWTAWNAWPSFPPVVQEILVLALRGQEEGVNYQVGDTIVRTLPPAEYSTSVTIEQTRAGQSTQQRVSVDNSTADPGWMLEQLDLSGFYTATYSAEAEAELFAVNLADTRESRLHRIEGSQLPSQLQDESLATSERPSDLTHDPTPLFRIILGTLLMLLVSESVVAWYLGNANSG